MDNQKERLDKARNYARKIYLKYRFTFYLLDDFVSDITLFYLKHPEQDVLYKKIKFLLYDKLRTLTLRDTPVSLSPDIPDTSNTSKTSNEQRLKDVLNVLSENADLNGTELTIIYLHFYEKLTYKKIAKIMNIPPSTVVSKTVKALSKMKNSISLKDSEDLLNHLL